MLEMKHQVHDIQHLKWVTSLHNLYNVNVNNTSNGSCVLWSEEVDLFIHLSALYFIQFQVFDNEKNITWVGFRVHTKCEKIFFCEQFHYLILRVSLRKKVVLVGVQSPIIKSLIVGFIHNHAWRIFFEFITITELVDLGFIGFIINWSNKRSRNQRILERNDREFSMKSQCDVFAHTLVLHLNLKGASHKDLLVSSLPRQEQVCQLQRVKITSILPHHLRPLKYQRPLKRSTSQVKSSLEASRC